ncbi:NAD-dependent succinate-semialdehyde dehydrogenase [Mangrovimicrobium sediminis]|uniref:NAD-dependent succinate-semialdehyde dehydrogenase n=1 Tax=Mangrovimicrobium sediminis TaxID=2562682 RepID=A0A4Z0LXE7_9GAMM|nr:NAD-dependent succinate-semialdehyde dehydrogenase [Haliea sp. SAOS-164]TGD71828.1 NAD-dependent succinate-semialdehyde dehydrogenase [Haliea sp. SAOS-164]
MPQATDPTTGTPLKAYPALDKAGLDQAVAAAQATFRDWRKVGYAERAALLNRVADLLEAEQDALAVIMAEEMGKPLAEGRGEVQKSAFCARHYAENAEKYLAPVTLPSDATHSYVQHLPLGPVLGILPWNAPVWLAFRFGAPALMAGNTCLMKHDPHVPACAEAIAGLFERAGAPPGLLQNLPLDNPDVADAIRHPGVCAVSFTGSSAAGAKVAALAAGEIKPFVLELGGSDPAIVLADADLDAAVDTVSLSRIINAGQSCIAAKRLIVEAPVYDAFVEKLHARLAALKVGDPRDESNQVGPIARPDLRDNLHRQVQASVDAGARCLMGGEMPEGPGYFYPVTLLADVTGEMTACREETFGPVAVVMKAADLDDAIAIANDTQYGLGAAVWTAPERAAALAAQVASEIEAGQVAVNGIVKTDPRLPSGGVKRSGIGRELGPHGILEFVNVQQVWVGPKVD